MGQVELTTKVDIILCFLSAIIVEAGIECVKSLVDGVAVFRCLGKGRFINAIELIGEELAMQKIGYTRKVTVFTWKMVGVVFGVEDNG